MAKKSVQQVLSGSEVVEVSVFRANMAHYIDLVLQGGWFLVKRYTKIYAAFVSPKDAALLKLLKSKKHRAYYKKLCAELVD